MMTEEQTYDLKQYLAPLVRHRALLLTFVFVATVSSLAFTYVVSERYRATATVLYHPNDSVSFRPKTRDALGFPMPLVPLESIGNTIDELAHTDTLLGQTVTELHLDQKPPYTGGALMQFIHQTKDKIKELRGDALQILKYGRVLTRDPYADAVAGLKDNLKIKPSTKAYTFDLQVMDTNPQRAAATVNVAGRVLADLVAKADADSARVSAEKLAPQVDQSRQEVVDLGNQVTEFKERENISSLDEELSLRLKSISASQDELASVEHNLLSSTDREKELLAIIAKQPVSIPYTTTTTQNPVTDQLRRKIADLEVERSGLAEKLTPKHPQMKILDAQISDANADLRREEPKQVSAESVGVNEVRQKLLSEQLDTDSQIAYLTAQRDALKRTLHDDIQRAHALTGREPEQGQLVMQLDAAEKNYALVSEAYEEARLAEVKSTSSVIMLSPAKPPQAPVLPLKIVHVGVTLLLSIFLAIGGAYVYEFLTPTVHDLQQFQKAIQAPVFTTLPTLPGGEIALHQALHGPGSWRV
jgi:succinoglycan biosynthesis transport protein ExoP